jgi:uncharacterized protein (TIGR03000 family)
LFLRKEVDIITGRGIVGAAWLALAVAGLLWSPSSVSARPRAGVGRGYYSTGYGYGYRPSYYYSSGYYGYGLPPGYYYARPYYSSYNYSYPEYVTYEPNAVTYSTSSYRADGDASADDRAVVTIQIPADEADIWIQGEKSNRSKSRQDYISPPLTSGKKYFYDVRARWQEGNRTHDETRSFAIFPGKPVLVDSTRPAAAKP